MELADLELALIVRQDLDGGGCVGLKGRDLFLVEDFKIRPHWKHELQEECS